MNNIVKKKYFIDIVCIVIAGLLISFMINYEPPHKRRDRFMLEMHDCVWDTQDNCYIKRSDTILKDDLDCDIPMK